MIKQSRMHATVFTDGLPIFVGGQHDRNVEGSAGEAVTVEFTFGSRYSMTWFAIHCQHVDEIYALAAALTDYADRVRQHERHISLRNALEKDTT